MSMSNIEKTVKDIRRKTRRKFSIEEKKRHSGSTCCGEGRDDDETKNTQSAISRLDWRSSWQKGVSEKED